MSALEHVKGTKGLGAALVSRWCQSGHLDDALALVEQLGQRGVALGPDTFDILIHVGYLTHTCRLLILIHVGYLYSYM